MEDDFDEYDFEFELEMSEDQLTSVLHCNSSRPLSPDEYAAALRDYAKSISIMEHICSETRH